MLVFAKMSFYAMKLGYLVAGTVLFASGESQLLAPQWVANLLVAIGLAAAGITFLLKHVTKEAQRRQAVMDKLNELDEKIEEIQKTCSQRSQGCIRSGDGKD